MIKFLLNTELNLVKYDTCIANAANSRVYANSWYLNCVADKWGVLILNDYEAVMPLPIRRKYAINYVYLAPWVQQLGVFSLSNIDEYLLLDFIKAIPRKFKLVDVYLNSGNEIQHKNISQRINYILNLNLPYKEIHINFSKSRKWSIKQAKKYNLSIIESFDLNPLIQLFQINKGKEISESLFDFPVLIKLADQLRPMDKIRVYHVINENKILIGGAVFIIDNNRITYLFSVVNVEGREKQAMSILVDYMIRKYSNSTYIFDFEGSMIKDIAYFFKSFGAEKEIYYHFNQKMIF